MREYEPSKNPISLGEACQEMYQRCWFNSDPIKMIWNDVEILMRKITVPPKQRVNTKRH